MIDLRTHLDRVRDSGLLVVLDRPVDPAQEASRLMAELESRGRAGLFTSVTGSQTRLVYNLAGSRTLLALALNTSAEMVVDRFREAVAAPIAPERTADRVSAQEVVLRCDDVDLRTLPLVTHSERDAGPYITSGMVLAHDPQTGLRNVSFNRITPVDARTGAIRMMPPQHLGQIQAKAEDRGEDLPIAIAIGLHPTASLGAATSPPLGSDELAIAGALRGEPVPLAPALSVPVDVPAEAEIVIEGYVQAGVRAPEGPFGDFLQYYVPQMDNHRFRVTAITHRRDPLYQTMHAGSKEDVCILGLSREAAMLTAAEQAGADVHAVRLGPTILGATIAISTRYAGEAKTVAMAAFSRYRWLKYCIVVDDDVEIENDADVLWAVTTRTQLEHDVVVVPRAGGFPRDEGGMHDAKLIIDATKPMDQAAAFLRRVPPGGPRLRLEDFVSPTGAQS